MTESASTRALIPILVSAGILLGGNGLLVTLVTVRANIEGFSPTLIGLIGTAYFIGFFVGCLTTAKLIQRAGHIRVFAALSATVAITVLGMGLITEPWAWAVMRALAGFSFSGVIMVIESWLNEASANADRGRTLSLYRVVDLFSVTGAQFILPAVGAEQFAIFAVTAILFCLSLIPVSLSRDTSPRPPASARLRPLAIWMLSPVAGMGCLTLGLTNSAFRTIGPVYAQDMGLSVEQVAVFMSLGILAGALFQYPMGWLSDRFDRRLILIVATTGAALSSLVLSSFGHLGPTQIYLGGFLFGGFSLPLYSLSAAHANDHAGPGQFVELAAGLLLFYAIGASVGPLIAAVCIARFGPASMFLYTSTLHFWFVGFLGYRMTRRDAAPRTLRKRFVGLLRTSPAIFRLSRANGDKRKSP
jgi:MFS family permease